MTDDIVARLRAGTGDGLRALDWMNEAADRIEKLEAVLREIADGPLDADKSYVSLLHELCSKARAVLEGEASHD